MVQEDERLDNEVILQAKSMIARKVVFKNVADKHWIQAQKDDLVLHHVQDLFTHPKGDTQTLLGYLNGWVLDADHLAYAWQQKDLILRRELMYMETNAPSTKDRILTCLVLPNKCHVVLDGCHCEAGHQGRDRILSLLRERFFWPSMGVQATLSVKNYERCHQYKARPSLPEMVTISITEPLDLVHMDFVGMETTLAMRKQPVVKTVLVLVDHFTWYVHTYIVKDHQTTAVVRVLYDDYFLVFGFPHRLMSDNTPEFIGKVLMALCDLLNVKQVRTSPYHPQLNGSI